MRRTEAGASEAVRSSREGDALPTSIASLEGRCAAGRGPAKSAAVRPACSAHGIFCVVGVLAPTHPITGALWRAHVSIEQEPRADVHGTRADE